MRSLDTTFVTIALSLACLACDSEPAQLDCYAGDLALSEDFAARWSPPSGCTTDAECVLETPDVRCPGGGAEYSWCPRAVHEDDLAAFEATLDETLAAVCPRIPAECRGGARCARVLARCVEGRCAALDATSECVERCSECLERDACLAHCGAGIDCILEAASCDETRACVSGPMPPDAG